MVRTMLFPRVEASANVNAEQQQCGYAQPEHRTPEAGGQFVTWNEEGDGPAGNVGAAEGRERWEAFEALDFDRALPLLAQAFYPSRTHLDSDKTLLVAAAGDNRPGVVDNRGDPVRRQPLLQQDELQALGRDAGVDAVGDLAVVNHGYAHTDPRIAGDRAHEKIGDDRFSALEHLRELRRPVGRHGRSERLQCVQYHFPVRPQQGDVLGVQVWNGRLGLVVETGKVPGAQRRGSGQRRQARFGHQEALIDCKDHHSGRGHHVGYAVRPIRLVLVGDQAANQDCRGQNASEHQNHEPGSDGRNRGESQTGSMPGRSDSPPASEAAGPSTAFRVK